MEGAGNWGGWFGGKEANWFSGQERGEGSVDAKHVWNWTELKSEVEKFEGSDMKWVWGRKER